MTRGSFVVGALTLCASAAACSLFTDLGSLSDDGHDADAAAGDGSTSTNDGAVTNVDAGDGATTLPDGAPRPAEAYIVGAGGTVIDGGTESEIATTLFARVNADGSLGAWTAGPDLPTGRRRHGVIGIADELHVIGGYTPAALGVSDITTTRLGDGGMLGAFTASPSAAKPTNDSCPVIVANRAYLVTPSVTQVQYATLAAGGGFGGWQVQEGLDASAASYYGRAVSVDSQIFWFGEDTKAVASTVGADGKLGDWRALAPMPLYFTSSAGVAVAHGRFIYVVGGFQGTGGGLPSTSVYVAEVATDGTLGAWTATEPYAQSRYSYSVVAYAGFLYLLGGSFVDNADVLDVSYAKIRADGTLEPWKATTPLPVSHRGFCNYGIVSR